MFDTLALWLATYALHSTLLLLSAWCLARAFPAARQRLWRLAICGGLLTAGLHAGGYWPRVAYLELPGLAAPAARESAPIAPENEERASATTRRATVAAQPRRDHRASAAARVAPRRDHQRAASGAGAASSATARPPTRWWSLASMLWLASAVLSLLALVYRSARFHARFLARRRDARGPTQRLLDDLARRAAFRRRVRVTSIEAARVPMARGWLRPEICLPEALEDQLESEELEAALAHELAHLERHDPLWRAVTRSIASLFPFQPLNGLACRALEDEAELRCDDRAAALTGRPAALARCLTRVASWTANDRHAVALPALAANGSNLRRRVMRLLEHHPRRSAPWWAQALAAAPLVFVLAFAPGLGAAPTTRGVATLEATNQEASTPVAPARISDSTGGARPAIAAPVMHRLTVPTFGAIRPQPPEPPEPPGPPAAPPAPPSATPSEPFTPALAVAFAETAVQAYAVTAPAAVDDDAAEGDEVEDEDQQADAEDLDFDDEDSASDDGDDLDDEDEDESDEEENYEAFEDEDELLDEIAAGIDVLMEDLDDRIEMAMAVVEEAFGQELEAVEQEIDGQVESFDEELERSLEPLEQAIEELADELEQASEDGNELRTAKLERQLSDVGAAMSDLGGRLGALVGEAALTGVDEHLQTLMEAHGRTVQDYALRQADLGVRLAREIEERRRGGQALDDDEIQALEEELETIAEEAAPHYEELERQVDELTRQLEPTRERMRTLSVELRKEVDDWRLRHAELLRELEEDGVTVPSYEETPDEDDEPLGDRSGPPDRDRPE